MEVKNIWGLLSLNYKATGQQEGVNSLPQNIQAYPVLLNDSLTMILPFSVDRCTKDLGSTEKHRPIHQLPGLCLPVIFLDTVDLRLLPIAITLTPGWFCSLLFGVHSLSYTHRLIVNVYCAFYME